MTTLYSKQNQELCFHDRVQPILLFIFSPAIADYERENPAFKEAVKITLTPLLTSLTLLQYADIDSESEMLGYGIGIILLNIGMYFIAPAVLIMKVKKNLILRKL